MPTQLAANARAVIEVKHAEAPFHVIHHDQDVAISELRRGREKPGATPPSHRMFPALLDTNAITSSASPHSNAGPHLE